MIGLADKIAALPPYPSAADPISDGIFYRRMSAAYSQRLALAREWIAIAPHHHSCQWYEVDIGCTCGRDALFAALEPPK